MAIVRLPGIESSALEAIAHYTETDEEIRQREEDELLDPASLEREVTKHFPKGVLETFGVNFEGDDVPEEL